MKKLGFNLKKSPARAPARDVARLTGARVATSSTSEFDAIRDRSRCECRRPQNSSRAPWAGSNRNDASGRSPSCARPRIPVRATRRDATTTTTDGARESNSGWTRDGGVARGDRDAVLRAARRRIRGGRRVREGREGADRFRERVGGFLYRGLSKVLRRRGREEGVGERQGFEGREIRGLRWDLSRRWSRDVRRFLE